MGFTPRYETDLGRGVYIAGTPMLVGLNSAIVGTATYLARTDVVRSWLLNEIAAATPPPPPPPGYSTTAHLASLSTRLYVGTGNDVGITGFVIAGSGSKRVVLRALGPSLTPYGVPGALANPTIELRNSAGAVVAFNDDWQTDPQAATLIASGRAPADPLEAALAIDLPPGAYTAIVSGVAAQSGVALVELYDQEPGVGPRRLINASTRGKVLDGAAVMIAGFVVEGTQPLNVMMRGLGPTLSTGGIVDYLRNPTLELYAANGSLVATNDKWPNSADKDAIIATGLAPPSGYESAILKSLAPGAYTVILRGGADLPPPFNTGIGLVEVYEVPTR